MDKIIKTAGVRFRENWKVYDFDATDLELAVGDRVIVDSERGLGFAHVVRIKKSAAPPVVEPPPAPVLAPGELEVIDESEEKASGAAVAAQDQAPKVMRKILRKATEEDLAREAKNRKSEAAAFTVAQEMIAERDLPMKLIRVEYSLDESRATFFFFSETRVDFRDLVKDLAYKLKTRIEMRQIGVRDVARMIGGFGPCGRELCCSSFLKNFEPVSIRMAKKQEMVLNPAKISGVCGRLLCCLSYEYEMYDENKKDLAGMRETVVKDKRDEEERRIAEERLVADERRLAEEKRRQEDRGRQEQQRDKQKQGGKSGNRPDKRRDPQQVRKAQPQAEQQRDRGQRPPEKQPPQEQKAQQPQPEGEKSAKKGKRRRFWRQKKKGPQGPAGPSTK